MLGTIVIEFSCVTNGVTKRHRSFTGLINKIWFVA